MTKYNPSTSANTNPPSSLGRGKNNLKSTWYTRFMQHGDRPWQTTLVIISLAILALVISIGVMLWVQSSGARQTFGISFLLPGNEGAWDPINNNLNSWSFIYGTLITSLIAILIATPLSLGIAIFLAELCPNWLRSPLGVIVELLAAIPSVVYGFWGIFVFLPDVVAPFGTFLGDTLGKVPGLSILFSGPIAESGSSRLAASMILAIMILPTIASVARDIFLAIPDAQREASLALGATQWETISKVLIPYGLSGILGALILGLGRALGETMAVTMVIGNSTEGTLSLLKSGYTMSSIIANEFSESVNPLHSEALIEIGLILFGITLILNIIARLLVWRMGRKTPREARA